jgi:hypothetical protein
MRRVAAPGSPDPPAAAWTRWLGGFILLFVADAAQILLFAPSLTADLFAWRIEPAISAYVLASAYVAGSVFFFRVCTGSPWSRVEAGFGAITAFVWLAGIATLLHFDRLDGAGLPLLAWVALYVVTPFGVPAIVLANRGRSVRSPDDARLPRGAVVLLGAGGAAITLCGLVLFVRPSLAIEHWPWTLTPLTARVTCAVIVLNGTLWLTVAAVGRALPARIPLESQAAGLCVLVLSLIVGRDDIDWDGVLGPVLLLIAGWMLTATVAVRLIARTRGDGADHPWPAPTPG